MSKHSTGTRRPDGKPETDEDTRFFDLRASGYEGPIDQDGYAVTETQAANGTPRFKRNGGNR